jgi:integrase
MNSPLTSTDQARILTRSEIAQVVADLKRKRRSVNTRQNLVVFRLSACCGLRVSEISGLRICDVHTGRRRPHILIPETPAKRGRPRTVPLWWDADTLADIETWKGERIGAGAKPSDPLVCSQHKDTLGKTLSARNLQHRWTTAIKVLGKERVKRLSIHKGRHSFCSHALAAGRTILEVRAAAGHANVATTIIYFQAVTGR